MRLFFSKEKNIDFCKFYGKTFALFFGIWTIYCNLMVFFEKSFLDLKMFFVFPLFLFLFLCVISLRGLGPLNESALPRKPVAPEPKGKKKSGFVVIFLLLACLVGILKEIYYLFWCSGFLLIIYTKGTPYFSLQEGSEMRDSTIDHTLQNQKQKFYIFLMLLVLIITVGFTILANRPSGDDAFYLNLVVRTLDFPHEPLLKYDGFYGLDGAQLWDIDNRIHSYELLIAILSDVLNLHHFPLYYVFLPILMSSSFICFCWIVLRDFGDTIASISLCLLILTLIFWGDSQQSPGNWGLVKIYQGKCILALVCVPLMIFLVRNAFQFPTIGNWAFVTMGSIACFGFSSSGILIGPLVVICFLIGGMAFGQFDWRNIVGSFFSCLMPILSFFFLVVIFQSNELGHMEQLTESLPIPAVKAMGHPEYFEVLSWPLHDFHRRVIALLSPVLLMLVLPTTPVGQAFREYIFGFWLVVFNPLSIWIASLYMAPISAWRALIAVDFPILIGLLFALCSQIAMKIEALGVLLRMGFMFAFFYFISFGRSTFDRDNGVEFRFQEYKIWEDKLHAAYALKSICGERSYVLAPTDVSVVLVTIRQHPFPSVVRFYFRPLTRSVGKSEQYERYHSQKWIDGKKVNLIDIKFVRSYIYDGRLDCIMIKSRLTNRANRLHEFIDQRFHRIRVGEYDLFVRS